MIRAMLPKNNLSRVVLRKPRAVEGYGAGGIGEDRGLFNNFAGQRVSVRVRAFFGRVLGCLRSGQSL